MLQNNKGYIWEVDTLPDTPAVRDASCGVLCTVISLCICTHRLDYSRAALNYSTPASLRLFQPAILIILSYLISRYVTSTVDTEALNKHARNETLKDYYVHSQERSARFVDTATACVAKTSTALEHCNQHSRIRL
jgi:hypothetical protein